MERRRFVRLASALPALGVAGCLGDARGDDPSGEDTETPAPEPDGPSYEFDGSGEFESDPFSLEPGLLAVDYHNESTRHHIELFEAGDDYGLNVVNESHAGGFDGTGVMQVAGGEYAIYVEGLNWQTTVRQPRYSEAEYESLPFETSGTDHALLGPFEFEDSTAITIAGEHDVGVTVDLLSLSGGELAMPIHFFNDEGEYEETGTIEHVGPALVHVKTLDSWTVSVGET